MNSSVNLPLNPCSLAKVCLALLRSDRDWIGGGGGIKTYRMSDGEIRAYADEDKQMS